MFTFTFIPNPAAAASPRVVRTIQVATCRCGSSDVFKSYATDGSGDVDGVRFDCRVCGAMEVI